MLYLTPSDAIENVSFVYFSSCARGELIKISKANVLWHDEPEFQVCCTQAQSRAARSAKNLPLKTLISSTFDVCLACEQIYRKVVWMSNLYHSRAKRLSRCCLPITIRWSLSNNRHWCFQWKLEAVTSCSLVSDMTAVPDWSRGICGRHLHWSFCTVTHVLCRSHQY